MTTSMPAQTESIDQILQAGWYLLKLINEILDLAKDLEFDFLGFRGLK